MAVQIQSGQYNTGNITPWGRPMMLPKDNPYITKDDFILSAEGAGLGITESSTMYTNGQLDLFILRACSAINRYCRRYFDVQTIDETKTRFSVRPNNPELVTIPLQQRPYQSVNSIYLQVLKWYVEITREYLQEFPDKGFYKIVPMLSSVGNFGVPLPATIVDRIPLGVLWTNYTFGYGVQLTAQELSRIGSTKSYQADYGNRLWAPSQTTTIYDDGDEVASSDIESIDYANGIVTFVSSYTPTGTITADFTTNESVPSDIREAAILLTAYLISEGKNNPQGLNSVSIQTFSASFGDAEKNPLVKRAKDILDIWSDRTAVLI